MRRFSIAAGSVVATGLAYTAIDGERRRKAHQVSQSSYRIANLVSTVGYIIVDYGIAMNFNQNIGEAHQITLKINDLTREIEKIQTQQEDLTIEQWRTKDKERVRMLQTQIGRNRQRLDIAAEEVGQLSTEHDAYRPLKDVHDRSAKRLTDMCARNQGLYIKLGQHIAMLDHIFPEEYHRHLSRLLANTPRSSWEAVRRVIKQDLGKEPEELFLSIEHEPIASASLAQVHIAYDKDGHKCAVKCQHEGLLESSSGDMAVITFLIYLVSSLFRDFDYTWLTREMNHNLPKELDFTLEAANMVKCASLMRDMIDSGDVAVPKPVPDRCSHRVITMNFEEGGYITDLDKIKKLDLQRSDVSSLVSRIFCEQMYRHGFVHCDPHEANLLVRSHPFRKGKPQVVLLDHGLYRELQEDFRIGYARLWRGLIVGDETIIKEECQKMNSGPAYTLLAAMLTMRPWDDIVSDDVQRLKNKNTKGEAVMLRGYAKKYFKHIVKLLGDVDSDMLLLLKTNDCLRHVDKKLGTPVNSAAVVGATVAEVLFHEDFQRTNTMMALWQWWQVMVRVRGLTIIAYVLEWRERWWGWYEGWGRYLQRGVIENASLSDTTPVLIAKQDTTMTCPLAGALQRL